ncbi:hypothetical protein P691DRAFT_778602 [Macrolepiota fuliginosa MF-IS2]|uniref:BTB domain-containing protein n=1 Tax=Macrolepiota fuliginosa MF-IS2 TaxID=1400762 RepID=A0A9P6BXD5_9AGAR|nr:hypothetical protein P691DRAFT_778602 [Macrolepiota fuliginosa MF-IS2]
MTSQSPPKRDSTYYTESGESCIFQAENCLFRIHRYHIERWPSVLKAMLSLEKDVGDNPTIPVEGRSDDNPIICEDTAENFRALCWILYASPKEICIAHLGDVRRLVALASITHKYEFTDLEDWVLELLGDKVPDDKLTAISVDRLETLLFITIQTQHSALAVKIKDIMVGVIGQSQDPLCTLATVIPIAERTADGAFQAKLYHAYLRAEVWRGGSPSQIADAGTTVSLNNIRSPFGYELLRLSGLTENQRLKLYCGYCSLMLLRMRLQKCPQDLKTWELDDWWVAEISRCTDGMYDDPGKLLEEMSARLLDWTLEYGSEQGSRATRSVRSARGRKSSVCYDTLAELESALDKDLAERFMCS